MSEDVGDDAVHADLDGEHVTRPKPVSGAQLEERVDRRVGEGARRIGLDRDARGEELPGAAEPVKRRLEPPGASERGDIPLLALERRLGCGQPLAGELRGEDPVPRRVPRVIGLGHRAEVLLEPRGVRGGDREGVARLDHVEPQEPRRRCGAAEGTDRGRRVPAASVVLGIERGAESRADLEADDVGERHGAPVGRLGLSRREGGRQERHARVPHQREVRVVEVVRVPGRAVGERGPPGGGHEPGAHDGRQGRAALGARDRADGARGGLARAGEHHAERIERGQAHAGERFGRAVLERGLDGELREPGREAHRGTIS